MKNLVLLLVFLFSATGMIRAQVSENERRPEWPVRFYAPYVYAGAYPLPYMMQQTGIRYFTLAFVLNGQQDCQAAWDGGRTVEHQKMLPELETLRAQGGDVSVSFGGAAGDELALACTDVESLTAAYQSVVDAYRLTRLDFDIEGDELSDDASIQRRSQALAALQRQAAAQAQPLEIVFTLPVDPDGLTDEGIAVLQSAIDQGVDIAGVNIMTMDYGSGYPADQMGVLAVQAAESLHRQLTALYPPKDDAELWFMIGLTPMIGLNDTVPQVFTLDDAEMIVNFATEKGIRQISMWSLNRDKACAGNVATVSDTCSGVEQDAFAFSTIFNRMTDRD